MIRYMLLIAFSGLVLTSAGCTFKDTSNELPKRVSIEDRESPPPAGVTENPGQAQSTP